MKTFVFAVVYIAFYFGIPLLALVLFDVDFLLSMAIVFAFTYVMNAIEDEWIYRTRYKNYEEKILNNRP